MSLESQKVRGKRFKQKNILKILYFGSWVCPKGPGVKDLVSQLSATGRWEKL
jgi:hypothetical protein